MERGRSIPIAMAHAFTFLRKLIERKYFAFTHIDCMTRYVEYIRRARNYLRYSLPVLLSVLNP